jgi:hypothetical protein
MSSPVAPSVSWRVVRERLRRRPWRGRVLIALVVVFMLAAIGALLPPLAQPAGYYDGADQRILLGIPNFGDVISNVGFLLVGVLGLRDLRRGRCRVDHPPERLAWTTFFFGVTLIALGSSYFHLAPDAFGLTLDRLPMALTFMALLSAVLIERVDRRAGLALLPVLIALALAAVLHWYWSEWRGSGDLRAYALVQVVPIVLIPLLLLLFHPRYDRGADYLIALGLYGLAMLSDALDRVLFELIGLISGHTLKHLIAAAAAYHLLRMLLRRRAL